MTDWIIRAAVIDDAYDLKQCMIAAYSPYVARMGGKILPPMDVDYADEITNYPVWVVVLNDVVVGGLIMSFEEQYASLANLCVHPNFQGHGIGKGILDYAKKTSKQKQYSEMRLATHILLTENLSLYKHLGWSEIERDETRVYMRKSIIE